MTSTFKTLPQLLDYFKDNRVCVDFLALQRWNGTPTCPHCDSEKVYVTNRGYKCANKECYKKFTVISGTMFENTKIDLRTWFAAMYLCTNHKKGISSVQLASDLGITQKTAWFLMHRIREMLKDNAPEMLDDTVEIDETFVGGKRSNMHASKRKELSKLGGGYMHLTPVFGLLERHGKVKTMVLSEVNKETLLPIIRKIVDRNSTIVTDNFAGYKGLKHEFKAHKVVSHGTGEYVRGKWHTNTIEGYWSLLKRAFRIISTKDIVFEVATAGNVQPIEKYKSGIYCFDDLGHESSVKVFGNDINVVEDLMTCRYRSFQNFGLITHATSNIPPKELANIYGTRLESRVNEMFNFIYLKGSDKRKI